MMDGHQWLRSRNVNSAFRSQCIPFYGCQSLWMGSSSRADETIVSWSLDGRPIPAPYQYSGNNGHLFCTEESQTIHSPLLCHDFYRQYNSGLLYQQTRRNTFTLPMHGGMGNSPLVLYCTQILSYSRQIQYIGRPSLEIGQTSQYRMVFGSIGGEFHFSNAQFPQCGFVCDLIQSQTSIVHVCFSSSGQSGLPDRCIINEPDLLPITYKCIRLQLQLLCSFMITDYNYNYIFPEYNQLQLQLQLHCNVIDYNYNYFLVVLCLKKF